MGCCASKFGGAGADGGDYAEIGVEKFDEIFGKAKAISDKSSGLQDALAGGKTKIYKNTGMEWVKDANLSKALECWVYSCGCDVKDPADFQPEVQLEEPYVNLSAVAEEALSAPNAETKQLLQDYIKALVDAPNQLKEMTDDMQAVADSASQAKDTAADDLGSLGMMEKAKAMQNLAGNMKKLAAAQKDLAALPDVLKRATEDTKTAIATLPSSIKGVQGMVDKTKELGEGKTSAVDIAKEVLDGAKNDQAGADAFAKANYGAGAVEETPKNKV